ncbi:MAG: GxxExxY protein [bacterium]
MNPDFSQPAFGSELSGQIVGTAMNAYRALRLGWNEKLDGDALVMKLLERGAVLERPHAVEGRDEGQSMGRLIPGLMVGDAVIADPKAGASFNEIHESQIRG